MQQHYMYNIDYRLIPQGFYLLLIISVSMKMSKTCDRNMPENT